MKELEVRPPSDCSKDDGRHHHGYETLQTVTRNSEPGMLMRYTVDLAFRYKSHPGVDAERANSHGPKQPYKKQANNQIQISPLSQDPKKATENATTTTPENKRQWIQGVLLCSRIVFGVFVVNVILTIVAVILAYGKNHAQTFNSAPIHKGKYNSAAYYSLGPSKIGVAMVEVNRLLEFNRSPAHKSDDDDCSNQLLGMGLSNFSSMFQDQGGKLQVLSKQTCIQKFARDYVYGQKNLVLVTSTALPSDQPLLYLGTANKADDYHGNTQAIFRWMCEDQDNCTESTLQRGFDTWELVGYSWSTPIVNLAIPGPDGAGNITEQDLGNHLDKED
ncbi:hypothetical protein BDW62DRAFT_205646 [Aspergillus aurantiobrunneus]